VIYSALKDYKKAEEYAHQALDIGKKANHNEKMREAAYLLYEIYRHNKKFEQALDMYLMYVHLRDSSNNEASRKASVRQQYKYEFEKKEAVLKAEQEKKDAVAEAESKRQKLYLILFGAITFAIAIVAIVVIRSLRITRRQKQIIEKQKQTVEEKQKEILDSIHYARRIQKSLLPSETAIEKSLKRLHK
jgi:tetratricopeptide (TPR) repeat protein